MLAVLRAAVGGEHVAIDPERARSQRVAVHDAPQRAADQPLDLHRAPGRTALRDLAGGPLAARGREHRVLARHPAFAFVLEMRRHAIFDRHRAQHAGVAHRDQHGAGRVGQPVRDDRRRAQLRRRPGRRGAPRLLRGLRRPASGRPGAGGAGRGGRTCRAPGPRPGSRRGGSRGRSPSASRRSRRPSRSRRRCRLTSLAPAPRRNRRTRSRPLAPRAAAASSRREPPESRPSVFGPFEQRGDDLRSAIGRARGVHDLPRLGRQAVRRRRREVERDRRSRERRVPVSRFRRRGLLRRRGHRLRLVGRLLPAVARRG